MASAGRSSTPRPQRPHSMIQRRVVASMAYLCQCLATTWEHSEHSWSNSVSSVSSPSSASSEELRRAARGMDLDPQ
eukprot:CAMPEP_0184279162 /NCGR_PEP_ID=MMETSP0977-20130417/55025_1 /TAXON_ID=483370 /ORGANISM="non described non described, Strain CCMP2097" /LENGTH=75 /DNA_ID=CAMNT_0026585095 /DNA_START=179 /DNA_END=406 /DNA_ORIENTATION=+